MRRIGLDLMGGDFAPLAVLQGVELFFKQNSEPAFQTVLIGDIELIKRDFPSFYEKLSQHEALCFVHASQVIEMCEAPTKAYSAKPDSSIAVGYKMLAANEIDSFASAGNTGAMMVGAFYAVKPIEGVIRPCISSIIPKVNNKIGVLLDVGVNPDCRQDVLLQFGQLGTAYVRSVFNIAKPRVALLNIGSEKEKGNLLTQAAYSIMSASEAINFVGNIEGYDICSDKYDVLVCDGFTGNVLLKTLEGFYQVLKGQNINNAFIERMNYENYGGTPILGINKPVVVGHGISSPLAFKSMLDFSNTIVANNLVKEIQNIFQSINNI